MDLTRAQRLAIDRITQYGNNHKDEAIETITHILKMSNLSLEQFERAVTHLKTNARIGLHFHPDRPALSKNSMAEALLEQGKYKSQFETLISNGSVSAYPGGARDLWEMKLFGGAYNIEGTTISERPKYGALNLMGHLDGPAPRFGSCYFLLDPKVSQRATYTYLDSHQDPREKGTYEAFDIILAALLEEVFTRDSALGEKNLTPTKLVQEIFYQLDKDLKDQVTTRTPSRNLNHYIEAQVHGEISLKEDVELLVADPSFKGTQIGLVLEDLCRNYSIELLWHMGYVLHVNDVPMNFRGPSMPSLARRIAHPNSIIDARTVGSAVLDLKSNPTSWSDRGTPEEVVQELKLLWHVLVKYGKPFPN